MGRNTWISHLGWGQRPPNTHTKDVLSKERRCFSAFLKWGRGQLIQGFFSPKQREQIWGQSLIVRYSEKLPHP